MFEIGDIIENKKNPLYILKVIGDKGSCVIVGSSNTDNIGKRKTITEFKFYKLKEFDNSIKSNLEKISFNRRANMKLPRKIKSYI